MATSPISSSKPAPTSPINLLKPNLNQGNASTMSVAPQMSTPSQAIGVRAVSPAANISKPPTTIPAVQQAPSSPGQYKGTVIKPGSDADIQGQIASIDKVQVPAPAPVAPVQQAPVAPQAPSSTPAVSTPTYPGLIGQLIQNAQGNSPYNQSAATSISGLQGTGNTNPATSGPAYNDYNAAVQNLKDLKTAEAAQFGKIESQPIPIEFQQGREAALARQYASQNQAAQEAVNQQQQQIQNQIQGVGVQQTGFNQAGSLALTGQGQSQAAYGTAISASQPQLGGYGQTYYNPLQPNQGGNSLDPNSQASSLAQQVISGQTTYDQAMSAMGYAGPAGATFLNNAITQAGGNPLSLQAQGTTQQGVISTQGTQIAGYQSALQQGQNLQTQLTDLIGQFGLNPNDINAVNAGLQKIAQNTSSPQYKILQNYVNDVANTYAQVLTPPGGSATDTTRGIASSMLDSTASGTSLLQVMKSLDEAAKAKIAGVSTTGGSNIQSNNGGSGGVVQTKVGAVNTNW